MDDIAYLKEIQDNYGHHIADYRWIGLGKGDAFNRIRDEYELANEIYDRGPDKTLGLADTTLMATRYKWTEEQRRNLLYKAQRHTKPRTPLPVEVTGYTANSVTVAGMGELEIKRPIGCAIAHGYLVRAGTKQRQDFYFAYSMKKSPSALSGVQARSAEFSGVQAPIQNVQIRPTEMASPLGYVL
jgi:hypothetical protein